MNLPEITFLKSLTKLIKKEINFKKVKGFLRKFLIISKEKIKKSPWFITAVISILILNIFLFIKFIPHSAKKPELKLQSTSITSTYLYQSINQGFKVYLGNRSSKQTPQVKMEVENSSIEFTPDNSLISVNDSSKVKFEKQDQKSIIYKNIYPGVDLRYSLTEKGIKEEIVIRDTQYAIRDTGFNFKLNLKNAVPQKDLMGNLTSTFIDDKTGDYRFHFEKPFMTDAGGNRSEQVNLKIQQDSASVYSSASFRVVLVPDQNWLKTALFPVIIDPTVVHDEQSDFTSGSFNRTKDVGTGSTAPSIQLYEQELPSDINTVGLWHLNEASAGTGSTAYDSSMYNNNGIGTGTSAASGKLSNARFFNGSSDKVVTNLDFSKTSSQPFTMSAWINVNSLSDYRPILGKSDANWEWNFEVKTDGSVIFMYYTSAGTHGTSPGPATGPFTISTNTWYHVAVVYNGSNGNVYINGVPGPNFTGSGIWQDRTNYVSLGYTGYELYTGLAKYFSGSIDEVKISNVARSAEEIKLDAQKRPYGTYTSPSIDLGTSVKSLDSLKWSETIPSGTAASGLPKSYIEFQTRTSANNSTWEEWRPTGVGSTVLDSMDSSSSNWSNDTTQVKTTYDSTGSDQTLTIPSGVTSISVKVWGAGGGGGGGSGAAGGGGAYASSTLNVTPGESLTFKVGGGGGQGSSSCVVGTGGGTAGSYGTAAGGRGGNAGTVGCSNGGGAGGGGSFIYRSSTILTAAGGGGGGAGAEGGSAGAGGGGGVNGSNGSCSSVGGTAGGNGTTTGGQGGDKGASDGSGAGGGGGGYLGGTGGTAPSCDSLGGAGGGGGTSYGDTTTNGSGTTPGNSSDTDRGTAGNGGAATAAGNNGRIVVSYNLPDPTISKSDETTIKMEGSGSIKTTAGAATTDTNTKALWHFEETSVGAGSTAYDSSGNSKDLTTSSVSLVDGFYGKARSFNGSSDYLYANASPYTTLTNWSLEAWIKPASLPQFGLAIYNGNDSGGYGFGVGVAGSDSKLSGLFGSVAWFDSGYTFPAANQWYHVVMTRDTTTTRFYVNGVQTANTSASTPGAVAAKFSVGMQYNTSNSPTRYFAGSIDEVRHYSAVLTAEQIAEAYRAGRDHRIERTLSSTDLSSKNKIPFYVAADRPGTYLETYLGETANSIMGADANTVGLWHLDEQSGSGAYIKDSSGNANHGTPTGTTFTQGKIGGTRYFNGSSDYIETTSNIGITGNSPLTIEFWTKATSIVNTTNLVSSGYQSDSNLIGIAQGTSATNLFLNYWNATKNTNVDIGENYQSNFVHIVYTFDGTTEKIYANGLLKWSRAQSFNFIDNPVRIGGKTGGYAGQYSNGYIDEVHVSNIARTADEIRQAYQYGLRTHQITIDYSTGIGSSAPTSTSDLDFNPTTTTGLYVGDTVIVREKVGATTYIMQGEVVSISSGVVTVASWSGTAPPSGYTTSANVFKWQREYWDISDIPTADRDAITKLGVRVLDGSKGFDMYLDDFKTSGAYLTNPLGGETITSTPQRYFQYRALLSTNDTTVTPALTSVTLDYTVNEAPTAPTSPLTNGQTNPTNLSVGATSPYFSAVYNDPNSSDTANKYQIQVDDDLDFNENQVLDNGDTVADWTSSDNTYFAKSQDTSDKQEGTGSIQVAASSVKDDVFYYLKTLGVGDTTIATKYANIDLEMDVKEGNQTISADTSWGNATADTRMLGVRVNGNLTIDAGKTLTATTRKRGMAIYVTGDLNLNGTISMTARGANAAGQQVLLLNDGTEYQVAAAGGASVAGRNTTGTGTTGNTGINNAAGGGGAGGNACGNSSYSGGGAAGTSYSGGSGGGAGLYNYGNGGTGIANGGAGGNSGGADNACNGLGGGAGNNGGSGWGTTGTAGANGTGGLLIIYVKGTLTVGVSGTLSAIGSNGGNGGAAGCYSQGGGGSGGGSVNAFYTAISGTLNTNVNGGNGGTAVSGIDYRAGGAGGAGSSRAIQSNLVANSLNATLTRDLGTGNEKNLSNYNTIKLWTKSTRAGSYLQFGLGENAWNDNTSNITINSANTWEEKTIDISGISSSNKDAIRYLGFKTTNADSDFTFKFDDIRATADETGSLIWDSGSSGTAMSDCNQGTRCTNIIYNGSNLTAATTYYWRIKYWDDEPTEGTWSTEVATFSVNYPPTAPTSLLTEGQINPNKVTDTTPEFSAIYNESPYDASDTANKYQIQVDDDPVFGSPLWDSGSSGTAMSDCSQGNRCSDITYGGNSTDLQWGQKYYWRIKYWDDGDFEGAWSTESAYFTMETIYPPTSCIIDDSSHPGETLIKWSDNTNLETGYRIEKDVDNGGWVLFSIETVNAVSKVDDTTETNKTYQYRVRANSNNGNSAWCNSSTVNYGRGTFYFQ